MTRKRYQKNKDTGYFWILDESISQDKRKWPTLRKKSKSIRELNLLSAKDTVISKTLDTLFPVNGKIIITTNKRPDKQRDYFRVSPIQGLVKFSSDIKTTKEQRIFLRKFQQMVKNPVKLLGAKITLTKTNIIYEKGDKAKPRRYTQYI